MGAGIYCYCCKSEVLFAYCTHYIMPYQLVLNLVFCVQVSPSLFEAHAGWASRRKPCEFYPVSCTWDFFAFS